MAALTQQQVDAINAILAGVNSKVSGILDELNVVQGVLAIDNVDEDAIDAPMTVVQASKARAKAIVAELDALL